jgi:HK97 family phage prohead protease
MIITRNGSVAFDTEMKGTVIARALPIIARAKKNDEDTSTLGRLNVGFTRFNTWYRINSFWEGTFLERVQKGAFKKTFAERGPKGDGTIISLFDHGYDPVIGNKALTVVDTLREDDDYAVLEGDLFDTSYNRDLAPGLAAGVYRSSFMFRVIGESWDNEPETSKDNPEGLPERTITEVSLMEAGPVTFPANPAATAQLNSARSDTDRMYKEAEKIDPVAVATERQRLIDLRTNALSGAGKSTLDDALAALQESGEPIATDHSNVIVGRVKRARQLREAYLASLKRG